jgi:hypothetical protein
VDRVTPCPALRRATQAEAKAGLFVDSYDQREAFTEAAGRMARELDRRNAPGELVYIVIPIAGGAQWQVYLVGAQP